VVINYPGQAAMVGDAKLAAMLGAWLVGNIYYWLGSFLARFVGGAAIALGVLTRRQPMLVPFSLWEQ